MLKDLILQNRSYRGFDESRAITKEELMDMVDCARLTASSVNQQPLQYYLAWEKEEVAMIQKMTKWAKGLPEIELPHPGMCPTAFIIICLDKNISDLLNRFQRDVGVAAQSILLRATEMGLGGCMIGSYSAAEIKEKLNFPEERLPMLVVAIGKPAETVVIKEIEPGDPTGYYRDQNDVHYVPKRKLKDVILTKE